MSELTINFSDYKSSGVYFKEVDNSIVRASGSFTPRLAVGFCDKGPFNRPIYLGSAADCNELIGGINRKLERKGCFTNRAARTMVAKSPLYLLNLLPVNTDVTSNPDKVGLNALSFDVNSANVAYQGLFADMFDRTKFWIADENAMVNSLAKQANNQSGELVDSPLFAAGNCSTSDISLIVRKAEGLTGYNVTFREWFGGEDQIPYKWINPNDMIADYFVQVIAIKGNWNADQYSTFASDSVWGAYFTEAGLKREMLGKFLQLDAVTVLGNWTGCILPNFYDKQNKNKSLDYAINKVCNATGLMFGINNEALETLAFDKQGGFFLDKAGDGVFVEAAPFTVDLVGHAFEKPAADEGKEFLSYNLTASQVQDMQFAVAGTVRKNSLSSVLVKKTDLSAIGDTENGKDILVGDYIKTTSGFLGKVVKRASGQFLFSDADGAQKEDGFEFTIAGNVDYNAGYVDPAETLQVANAPEIPDDDNAETTAAYQDFMVLGTGESSESANFFTGKILVVKNIASIYNSLSLIPLTGLKLGNRHMPGFDAEGKADIEAGIEKIYGMLEDPGIKRGLLNNDDIDFRYIVDTFAGGLAEECGGKKYLSRIADAKKHCTAFINIPSISDFAKSESPAYCDSYVKGRESKKSFNAKYIATGGNQDMFYADNKNGFSVITEDNGAKNAALFTPFFKYADGSNTILVPPAADVSNTFMNKFLGGDPYKTVANTNGYIANPNIVGLEYNFDTADRDALEPNGINPIVVKNGANYTIWGDRTAYQRIDSDYNFLHVREILNTIELKCYDVLSDYVFTYNIPQTRAEITTRLNPILQSMQDAGALVKYEIQIDENNNTKEVIDNKFCIVDINVWVSQNMEKIVARLTLNRSTNA